METLASWRPCSADAPEPAKAPARDGCCGPPAAATAWCCGGCGAAPATPPKRCSPRGSFPMRNRCWMGWRPWCWPPDRARRGTRWRRPWVWSGGGAPRSLAPPADPAADHDLGVDVGLARLPPRRTQLNTPAPPADKSHQGASFRPPSVRSNLRPPVSSAPRPRGRPSPRAAIAGRPAWYRPGLGPLLVL